MTDRPDDGALVAQVDREAAWPFRANCYGEGDKAGWLRGKYDHNKVIQAFARHRLSASPAQVASEPLHPANDIPLTDLDSNSYFYVQDGVLRKATFMTAQVASDTAPGVDRALALVRRIAAKESWQSHYGKTWEDEAAEIIAALSATPASVPDRAGVESLREALQIFIRAAYPVSTEINKRGYNWCEAYLDQAREYAAALSATPSREGIGEIVSRGLQAELSALAVKPEN